MIVFFLYAFLIHLNLTSSVVVLFISSYSCKINSEITLDVETFCNIFFTSLPILSKYISIFYHLICTILNFYWISYFLFYLMLSSVHLFLSLIPLSLLQATNLSRNFISLFFLFLKKVPSLSYIYYTTDIPLYTHIMHTVLDRACDRRHSHCGWNSFYFMLVEIKSWLIQLTISCIPRDCQSGGRLVLKDWNWVASAGNDFQH